MSKNKPLLSDTEIRSRALAYVSPYDREVQRTANWVREIYEAQLSKDRELIQTLTNSIGKFLDMANDGDVVVYHLEDDQPPPTEQLESALAIAGEQGYQPTEK